MFIWLLCIFVLPKDVADFQSVTSYSWDSWVWPQGPKVRTEREESSTDTHSYWSRGTFLRGNRCGWLLPASILHVTRRDKTERQRSQELSQRGVCETRGTPLPRGMEMGVPSLSKTSLGESFTRLLYNLLPSSGIC